MPRRLKLKPPLHLWRLGLFSTTRALDLRDLDANRGQVGKFAISCCWRVWVAAFQWQKRLAIQFARTSVCRYSISAQWNAQQLSEGIKQSLRRISRIRAKSKEFPSPPPPQAMTITPDTPPYAMQEPNTKPRCLQLFTPVWIPWPTTHHSSPAQPVSPVHPKPSTRYRRPILAFSPLRQWASWPV